MVRTTTVDLGSLDEERVVLRIRIAMLKEQGGNYAEVEHASDQLRRLNLKVAERRAKRGE